MIYEFSGKISHLGEPVSGQSKTTGNYWTRQTIVVEREDNNVIQRMAIDTGDRLADVVRTLKVGDAVKVGFTVRAREYNGKWYNNVDGVFIDVETAPKGVPAEPVKNPRVSDVPKPAFDPMPAEGAADQDLPF